ncbi:MAG TPA: ABC transporter permease subunit [Herpetosiphonaceae bacterium]
MTARLGRILAWALLLSLTAGPVALLLIQALSVRWFYPDLLPREWSAANLAGRLGDPQTQAALWLSLRIGLLVSGLSLLVGYPAARALELGRLPGKNLIYLLLFLPNVVPGVAVGIGLNTLFLRLDLAGTAGGVALAHLIPVLPYTVFTLGGVLANYDQRYEQQARVLGAGRLQVFRLVTLPLLAPGLVAAALFAFLISWSQYLLTFLIGGGQVQTLPLLLFATLSGGNQAAGSALALLFVSPLLLLIALAGRYLAAGPALGEGA